jgi:MFS superfamily sulfate permease-like transporter
MVHDYGIEALGVAVLAAGLLQVVAGAFKLGRWFRAVSPSLIQGMLAGIGVLIFASQFHVMVDDKPASSGLVNLFTIPRSIMRGLGEGTATHQLAAFVGVLTVVTIVAWNKLRPKQLKAVPGPLVAVVVGSVVANMAGLSINFVKVPESLVSTFSYPTLSSFQRLLEPKFLSMAIGMAFVASAETLLCAAATDRLSKRSKTDYDRELMAQGVGNALAGIVGALPITGVIVRSSANVEAGATTRWSAVAHGAWLLILVVAVPVLLTGIPTASLAGVLVFTGYKLANPATLRKRWAAGRGEFLVYGVTVVGIVSMSLLAGVLLGLACALLKLLITVTNLDVQLSAEGRRVTVALHGAATFVKLPTLAAILEEIPEGREVVLHVGGLAYIDHACMELLRSWQESYEREGGETRVAWDDLELRHNTNKPQLRLVASSLASPAESSKS